MTKRELKQEYDRKREKYQKISKAQDKLEDAKADVNGAIGKMPWGTCEGIEQTLEAVERKIEELNETLVERGTELKELEDKVEREELKED